MSTEKISYEDLKVLLSVAACADLQTWWARGDDNSFAQDHETLDDAVAALIYWCVLGDECDTYIDWDFAISIGYESYTNVREILEKFCTDYEAQHEH